LWKGRGIFSSGEAGERIGNVLNENGGVHAGPVNGRPEHYKAKKLFE